MTDNLNIYANHIENTYIQSTPMEHRKMLGQFFTDYDIACYMAKWILKGEQSKTVLDPAMGLGVFARAIDSMITQNINYHAYEVDERLIEKTTNILENAHYIKPYINSADFLFSSWNKKYKMIICNPPYLKFHDYPNKDTLIQSVSNHTNIPLNGFTNYYILFLLKALFQLKKNGRCAFIIPLEFLNSNYGITVKQFFIKSKILSEVITFKTDSGQFSDAITTSGIFLFENKYNEHIRFYSINSIFGISDAVKNENYNDIPYSKLDPEIKWHTYYNLDNSIHKSENLVPFSNFATVSRGIATGANEFFLFSKSKINQYKIADSYLAPIITKANFVKHNVFTQLEFDKLFEEDKNTYILDASDGALFFDNNLKKYIKYGEDQLINERYLTKHRNPWYKLEKIKPAPIWVSVFTRNDIKFILNLCGIKNLTTFHGVYLEDNYKDKLYLLFSYLLTPLSKSIFQRNKRQYGDGLDKFEPNDINTALCLNLDSISKTDLVAIEKLYHQYIDSYTDHTICQTLIEQMNSIFSKYYLLD